MGMTRNKDHEAYSKKKFKTCDNDDLAVPWSDLHHDVLFLVMMQLGFVDFVAFSGVCKSWRSFALSNRNMFLMSRPPMSIRISRESNEKDYNCYLYIEGRNFKTILPHSASRTCVGSMTCGYLALFGLKTNDFWLVNPITRHELHFPDPCLENVNPNRIRAILVYSPSISALVLVVLNKYTTTISFSVVGTRTWNHVTSTFFLDSLYAFKGKIYIITTGRLLCELRLDPHAKLMLLDTKNYPKPGHCLMRFLNLRENLYVVCCKLGYKYKLHEPDVGGMELVLPSMIVKKYDYFLEDFKYGFAIKPESWADPWSQYT